MAEAAHASVEMTTQRSTTSTSYTDVTGASLDSSNFTTGNDYLIRVWGAKTNGSSSSSVGFQVVHGSTAFEDSEDVREGYGDFWQSYFWFDVWTAVASEGIKVQFKATGSTAYADYVVIEVIDLDDAGFTENTDYFITRRTTDDTIDQDDWSSQAGASVTFTPSGTNQEWLVMSLSQLDAANSNRQHETRINRDSGADVACWAGVEAEDTSDDLILLCNVRPWSDLTAAEHTFTEQSRFDGNGSTTRYNSKMFAIQLDAKFKDVQSSWVAGSTALGTTAYGTNVETEEFTPSQTGDISVAGGYNFSGSSGDDHQSRMQIEESDNIADVTTDAYDWRGWDSTDARPHDWGSIENVAASAQTLDLDASNASSGSNAEQRYIVTFSLEVVSSGQTSTPAAVTGTWAAQALSTVPGAVTSAVTAVAGTWATQAVTLTVGAVTVTPVAVTGTWSAQSAATVAGALTTTPASVTGTWAVSASSTVPGAVSVGPSAVGGTWAVPGSTTVPGAVTASVSAVSGTWAVQPAVTTTVLTVKPAAVSATWAAQSAATLPGAVTASVAAVSGTWSVLSVSTVSGNIITPAAVTASWATQPANTLPGGVTAAVATVAATWSVSVALTTSVLTITPAAVTASWSTQAPSTVPGAVAITPEATAAVWQAGTASTVPGAVTISPATVTATWAVSTVTTTTGTFTIVYPTSGTIAATATSGTITATATTATVGTTATTATVTTTEDSATVTATNTSLSIDSEA